MPTFLPLSAVRITDPFWQDEQRLIRNVVLPYQWEMLNDRVTGIEPSRCIRNFRIAAGLEKGEREGVVFLDTDLYKWLEAVAYCLTTERDEKLEQLADGAIALIEAAQEKDGYLDTYYTLVSPGVRWRNLMEGHELYCAGHYIEAAVAYYQATGKRPCLDVATRLADCIDRAFGSDEGKLHGYAGHPIIELALVKLSLITGEKKYLDLAEYFVAVRGAAKENWFDMEKSRPGHSYIWPEMARFDLSYFQAHKPILEQSDADGHAVRAMYLYSAMADLARLKGDRALAETCEKLYQSATRRRMYVTGGIGSCSFGERFTTDYDLPNDSVYAETCASVGLMMFSNRMFLLTSDVRYYGSWERALYNTVLAGLGRDGRHFFYVNPLAVTPSIVRHDPLLEHVKTVRQPWFGVACCPTNIARTLSSLGGCLYAQDEDTFYVLSPIASTFHTDGLSGELTRDGDEYALTLDAPPMSIVLREPEGFRFEGEARFRHAGGRAVYRFHLIPLTRLIRADPRVSADAGKVCVMRGQSVYCLEEADNGRDLCALYLPSDARFTEKAMDFLPSGLTALCCEGYRALPDESGALYGDQKPRFEKTTLTFVPYSQWNNRGEGEMRVWLCELPV